MSLREKQAREILDIWGNLGSQVTNLTRKQVNTFNETIKPKIQRDVQTELNSEKSFEQINKIIEVKLQNLDLILNNASNHLGDIKNVVFANALQNVNNIGEIISLWNNIVRLSSVIGINKDTEQQIKIQSQQLKPSLDAIIYGLTQYIDKLFNVDIMTNSIASAILGLLRTLSIYTELKTQVDSQSSRFRMLSVDLLESIFKNIFNQLSQLQIESIKPYINVGSNSGNIASIRTIPLGIDEFDDRIRALEDELGVKLEPDEKTHLRSVSGVDLNRALQDIRETSKPEFGTKEINNSVTRLNEVVNELFRLEEETRRLNRTKEVEQQLIEEIEKLKLGPISEDEAEEKQQVEEQLPIDVGEFNAYMAEHNDEHKDLDDYNHTVKDYHEKKKNYLDAVKRNANIRAENLNLKDRIQNREIRDQLINEKNEELNDVREHLKKLERAQTDVERRKQYIAKEGLKLSKDWSPFKKKRFSQIFKQIIDDFKTKKYPKQSRYFESPTKLYRSSQYNEPSMNDEKYNEKNVDDVTSKADEKKDEKKDENIRLLNIANVEYDKALEDFKKAQEEFDAIEKHLVFLRKRDNNNPAKKAKLIEVEQKYDKNVDNIKQKYENLSQKKNEIIILQDKVNKSAEGHGKPKPLASMKKNYQPKQSIIHLMKPQHFDDSKNDNYLC